MITISEQTHDEKVAMYMAIKKKVLCEMLIECNRLLDLKYPIICAPSSQAWECPRCNKIHSYLSLFCDCPPNTFSSTTYHTQQ
jgi:hypothetical protein